MRTERGSGPRFEEWKAKGGPMPVDPTPQGGEVTREPPEPRYPEPKPVAREQSRPAAGSVCGEAEAPRDRPRVDPLTGAGEDVAG